MSKAVRIRDHLYEEIERLAKKERRSLIGQLEILLEQALKLPPTDDAVRSSAEPITPHGREAAGKAWTGNTELIEHFPQSAPRDDVTPDFKKGRK